MILQPEDVFLRGCVLSLVTCYRGKFLQFSGSPLVLRMIALYQRNGAFTTPKGLNQELSVVMISCYPKERLKRYNLQEYRSGCDTFKCR